jgi:hypothetical protein
LWKKHLRKREHLEDLGVDGRIILKFILDKSVRVGEDWIDLVQRRTIGGFIRMWLYLGSIESWEFID